MSVTQAIDTRPSTSRGWRDALSRRDIEQLLELEDWRSWLSIGANWGLVAASFALVAWLPHVVTIVLALFVIGARQLGLAVLMHEAAHRTLFSNRRTNDWAGSWLCAYPVWSDLHRYRNYHLQHHARTWTKDDPDLALATPFPVTRASLLRKFGRDISGQTGIKFARSAWRRGTRSASDADAVGLRSSVGGALGREPLVGMAITNGLLLGALSAVGRPELYLLWAGAWLTTNTLVTRIRSIAEHSMIPEPTDELRNTRTTVARWWERLLLCPNRVNYHLEHHLLMTVPHYHLPRMHALLRERGVLADACVAHGYLGVLRRAASRAG